jgi:phenylalanyl-tRNA synthetase beta chain
LRAEESVLRTRILPGLLRAVARNAARGLPDVALFELGRVFLAPQTGLLPDEPTHVAVVIAGTGRRRPVEEDRPVDTGDVVEVVNQLCEGLEIAAPTIRTAAASGFDPAASAAVLVDGIEIGVVGELASDVREAVELPSPVVALELSVDGLLAAPSRDRTFRAPSPYPPSNIDLAFVVGNEVAAGDVAATLSGPGGELLEEVRLFDVFRSDALGLDHKSLAYALRFRAPDRTLTDAEVGALRQHCIDAVIQAHGAELRG